MVLHIEKPNQTELIQFVKCSYTCYSDMLRKTIGSLWVQASCKKVEKVLLMNIKQEKGQHKTKRDKGLT